MGGSRGIIRVVFRRGWKLLLVICCMGGVVALVVWALSGPSEPEYQGKKLSQWALDLRFPKISLGHRELGDGKAREAVRAMGTGALPVLIGWVRYHPSWFKLKWVDLLQRLPSFGRRWDYMVQSYVRNEGPEEATGVCFQALGPVATPACPELARLLVGAKSEYVQWKAGYALANIGASGLPYLVNVLTNEANTMERRVIATACMRSMGTNGLEAVPVLIGYLGCEEPDLAAVAARSLGRLGLLPGLVVPALSGGLGCTNTNVRYEFVSAFGMFGKAAKPALPVLEERLSDPDEAVRGAATIAVRSIKTGEEIERVSY